MAFKASIDIGTNSTRLLVVNLEADGHLNPIEHHERLTKLGAGLSDSGMLDHGAMERVLAALADYRQVVAEYEIKDVRIFATSATRDARNRELFKSLILDKTGWACRVLSGDEEARLSFLGVTSDFDTENEFLVCDVGGGSTEFIFACDKMIQLTDSLDVGSGRMTRQFLKSDPADMTETSALAEFVRVLLDENIDKNRPVRDIVSVGGTAAALALMDSETSVQNSFQAHHYRLSFAGLERIIYNLAGKSLDERASIIGLHPKRADVILGGALIFSEILNYFDCDSMLVSLRDLMFGILLDERF